MRGGLDEALARMARREEALRRRATEPGDDAGRAGPEAGRAAPGATRAGAAGRDPVEEVAAAVWRVVAEHPGVAVSVRVEHDGQAYPLRIAWSDTGVTVSAEDAPAPPPAWPASGKTVPGWTPGGDGLTADPAARLAEMIRQDPSLLHGDPQG